MAGIAASVAGVIGRGGRSEHSLFGIFTKEHHRGNKHHHLTLGKPKTGDKLLYQERAHPSALPQEQRTHVFEYHCRGEELITAVEAKDSWGDNYGGTPQILSGGPDQRHVKVKVTSRMGKGFDFTVSVYGKQ